MTDYYRVLTQYGPQRPEDALTVAGGWCWFTHVEVLRRGAASDFLPASELPRDISAKITRPRAAITGLSMAVPRLMGVLNVTPDSFSDGGDFSDPERATDHALQMVAEGADIIDIGGESTRPGADEVAEYMEVRRTVPVISAIREKSDVPISIDTRKSLVAASAVQAGANLINDVSACQFDPQLFDDAAKYDVPICLMHAPSGPKTMQDAPEYQDVLLDVFDFLEARITRAIEVGIRPENIIIDPGLGFGKTLTHNLRLLQNISLFHALGYPILLGASRKRFIGTLGNAPETKQRMPGSVAVALAGIAQGVQIVRVHDIPETKQALTLWSAATGMGQ
ncbi:MAG: dihydropteroate synthase [Paracoccaceae bacterium]